MKKQFILLFIALSIALIASSQTPGKKPSYKLDGNTITAINPKKPLSNHDSTTTYKYTDNKGITHPVFISRKGSYYVWVISKNNTPYKKYLKFD